MVYVQQIERCQPLYRASANLVLPSSSFPFLLSSLFLLPPSLPPSHPLRQGKCRLSTVGHPCEIGLRRRTYHILAGSVLGVWTHLEGVFVRHSGHNSRMQIARVRMPNKRLVGTSAECWLWSHSQASHVAWEWDHYMYGTCTDYWQYNLVLVLITKSKKK